MKIWDGVPKVSKVYDKQKNLGNLEKSAGVSEKKDVISISGQGKDFQTIMKALKDVPDIRKDKVDELTQKFHSNSYDVSENDIADKIVKSLIDKKI